MIKHGDRIVSAEKTYPQGHWMGIGISIGLCVGVLFGFVVIGVLMDNITLGIALGPSLGMGLGCGIGAGLEAKHKDQIQPLTDEEKRFRKRAVLLGIGLLLIGVLFFTVTLFFRR